MTASLINLGLPAGDEQRLCLESVTWQQYDSLVSLFINQFSALRMTYLEGSLELVITSPEHERLKKIIARLIEAFAEADIELNGYGSATLRQKVVARGLDPDECYSLGELGDAPDIAIEIVLTSGGIDKLDVYKGLGVREVWFLENQTFSPYGLIDPDSGYETLTASRLLPQLDLTVLAQFIDNPNQTQAVKAYRRTLQKQLQASS